MDRAPSTRAAAMVVLAAMGLPALAEGGDWDTVLPPTALHASARDLGCDADVEQVASGDAMRLRELLEDSRRSRPLFLRGIAERWPLTSWGREGFLERFGNQRARVREARVLAAHGFRGVASSAVINDFVAAPPTPNVIFDNEYTNLSKAVLSACCREPLTTTTSSSPALRSAWPRRSYDELVEAVHGKPIVSASLEGAGVGMHRHFANFLVQGAGRKVWFLSKEPLPDDEVPRQPCHYLLNTQLLPKSVHRCVAHPGDVIYLPDGYLHATCNLDDWNLAVGWEVRTADWSLAQHAIADGNVPALQQTDSGAWGAEELKLAAKAGRVEALKLLLANGVDVHRYGQEAMNEALDFGHVEIVDALADRGVAPEGRSMLTMVGGHVAIVELQLARGARLENGDKPGRALRVAAEFGHVGIVELLLRRGWQPDAPDEKGRRPLHYASSFFSEPGFPSAQTALRFYGGHASVVSSLLDGRATIAAEDNAGWQPIHLAASAGHTAVVARLLERRAEADAKASQGEGPRVAHVAADAGHAPILELLARSGGNLSVADDGSKLTPLGLAVKGHHEAAEVFLRSQMLAEL